MKALTQDDERLLCGRAAVITEIVATCRAQRLTVVISEPGFGVTSLFQAGLGPVLRREGAVVVYFNDWQGKFFLDNLRESVAHAIRDSADPEFYAQSESLDALLRRFRHRANVPVVILLDQFEDYVRCHANSELSDSFDSDLAQAVGSRAAAFVVGIQRHAIPAFERLQQHIPNILGFRVELGPLTPDAAKEAVTNQAERVYMTVEPDVLQAVVSAPAVLCGENLIHPFFLKAAVETLIGAASRTKSMTVGMPVIETRGSVDRVVLEYLDPNIDDLNATHKELLFRWCNLLISPERQRIAVTEKGLTDYAGKLNRYVLTLLPKLLESGILRTVDVGGVVRYEISRHCFVPILRDWWERREAFIAARRRALFRVRSLSVAATAITLTYVIWLIWGK